jgi:hypothetical protein
MLFTKNKVVDSQNKVGGWIALIGEAFRDIGTTWSENFLAFLPLKAQQSGNSQKVFP